MGSVVPLTSEVSLFSERGRRRESVVILRSGRVQMTGIRATAKHLKPPMLLRTACGSKLQYPIHPFISFILVTE